jgi:hypothetical protein
MYTRITVKILSIFWPYVTIVLGSSRHEREVAEIAEDSLTFGAGIIFLILAHPVYKM